MREGCGYGPYPSFISISKAITSRSSPTLRKSLFFSTLRYFFEGERERFEGLYIDTTGWGWEKYLVLQLDLYA